jgi:LysR family cys regulon transcriptional activator
MVLIARADHPLAGQTRVTWPDVAAEPFVVAWGQTGGDQLVDRELARAGLKPRRVVMQLGNQDGVRLAVLERVGLGVVARRVVQQDLAARTLVALPLDGFPVAEQSLLIYRRAHHMTPISDELLAFLRAESLQVSM